MAAASCESGAGIDAGILGSSTMWLAFTIKSLISLTPVVVFLVTLLHLDSYKLVRFHLVTRAILAGGVLAMMAYAINGYALAILALGFTDYSRYVAPFIEELLKAAVLVYLFRSNRIGFPVDAIILGFAVGTGFALLENLYYLQIAASADIGAPKVMVKMTNNSIILNKTCERLFMRILLGD